VKVHADKTDTHPPHALTVRDVRRALAAVPPAWTKSITSVRLTNKLGYPAWAFLSRHDGTLTIYSRGSTLEATLTAILSELAAASFGIDTRHRHRRSAAETHRIGQLIQPLIDRLLPSITSPKPPLGYHPSTSFHPVSLTNESA
jgi:hypothetical protein